MHTRSFLIAGGNKTLLVWGCPQDERLTFSKDALTEVEQVGFVDEGSELLLSMMGGELCIDAMMALASQVKSGTRLYASGLTGAAVLSYDRMTRLAEVELPLRHSRLPETVIFDGIGYKVVQAEGKTSGHFDKDMFRALAHEHQLPAFGVILHTGRVIRPFVYVCATDSLCEESACGSGSIAFYIVSGHADVVQPTGESITVQENAPGIFRASAFVVELN